MKSTVTVTVVCVECEQCYTFKVKSYLEQTCTCGAELVVKVDTAYNGARQYISVRTRD